MPCKIAKVYQVFPYNLMSDYVANSKQPFWHMTMIRDPVDRVRVSLVTAILFIAFWSSDGLVPVLQKHVGGLLSRLCLLCFP